MPTKVNQIQRHLALEDQRTAFSGCVCPGGASSGRHHGLPDRRRQPAGGHLADVIVAELALAVARQTDVESPGPRHGHGILGAQQVLAQALHHGLSALFTQHRQALGRQGQPGQQPPALRQQAAMGIGHPGMLQQLLFELRQRDPLVGQLDDAIQPPLQHEALPLRQHDVTGLLPATGPGGFDPERPLLACAPAGRLQHLPGPGAGTPGNDPGLGAAVDLGGHDAQLPLQALADGPGQAAPRGHQPDDSAVQHVGHPVLAQAAEQHGAGDPDAARMSQRRFQQAFGVGALDAMDGPAGTQGQHHPEAQAIEVLRRDAADDGIDRRHRAQRPGIGQGFGLGHELGERLLDDAGLPCRPRCLEQKTCTDVEATIRAAGCQRWR